MLKSYLWCTAWSFHIIWILIRLLHNLQADMTKWQMFTAQQKFFHNNGGEKSFWLSFLCALTLSFSSSNSLIKFYNFWSSFRCLMIHQKRIMQMSFFHFTWRKKDKRRNLIFLCAIHHFSRFFMTRIFSFHKFHNSKRLGEKKVVHKSPKNSLR